MLNAHRIFAGLGAGLIVVGHNIPGPVGWVLMGLGTAITTAVNGGAVLAGAATPKDDEP